MEADIPIAGFTSPTNAMMYKLNKKYYHSFRKWININYGILPFGPKTIAKFRDGKKLVSIYKDSPVGEYVNEYWDGRIKNGFNKRKIPKFHGPPKEKFVPVSERQPVEYAAYIKSASWKMKSIACSKRANKECEVCASTASLQAHHYNYLNLGYESEIDLFCLCDTCHELYHYLIPAKSLPIDRLDRGSRLLHIVMTIQKAKQKIREQK